jgi:hypothetical protein
MSNLDNPRWTIEEDSVLKMRVNESYDVLSREMGRSVRSLKQRIGVLGLKREERRRWSKEEIEILESNSQLSPKDFVERGLLKRGVLQVAMRLREKRGTANRKLKNGWDNHSEELAYILGA